MVSFLLTPYHIIMTFISCHILVQVEVTVSSKTTRHNVDQLIGYSKTNLKDSSVPNRDLTLSFTHRH